MKLDYKKTIFVGFAFFLICAFWQAYDAIVPIMLVNKFGLNQTWSGVIMALDNILALFMIPLFGAISDKKKSKYGRRTPFIVIGTICAVLCFTFLTVADYAQLKNNLGYDSSIVGSREETTVLWDANPGMVYESPDEGFFDKLFSSKQTMPLREFVSDEARIAAERADYEKALGQFVSGATKVNPVRFRGTVEKRSYSEWREFYLTMEEFAKTKDLSLLGEDAGFITVSSEADFKGISMRIPKSSALLSETYRNMDAAELDALEGSGNDPIAAKSALSDVYTEYVTAARSSYAKAMTYAHPVNLIIFIVLLLGALISMATFRSPAVALMPDVTVKPLRSKANAIINLMGTAGGMIVLGLGMVFKTTDAGNALMNYTPFVLCVCGVMIAALVIFLLKVRENKFVAEMEADSVRYGTDDAPDDPSEQAGNKKGLTKAEKRSLGFILASVALWYVGYNAITSKYSLYATNVLDKDYNLTLLLAQGAAIAAYVPVGMISTKFGRKRTVIAGVIMLTVAFGLGAFITSQTPSVLMYLLFVLAGIGWATINVNSFPMVVELSDSQNVGKYTGYYYTASMAAQIATPILSGILMDKLGMRILFPYGAIFAFLALLTMFAVRHGDSKKEVRA